MMEQNDDFHFRPNLERMAKVAVGALLWEKEVIRNKMEDYFYKHHSLKSKEEWEKITKSVIELLDSASLCQPLYHEMVYVIRDMGLKILDWFNTWKCSGLFRATDRTKLYENYLKDIYWTHYGSIDELRIFNSSWMNNPDILLFPLNIFNAACFYCLEDKLSLLWKNIDIKLREMFESGTRCLSLTIGSCIDVYWVARTKEPSSLEEFNKAIVNESDNDGLFFLSKDYSPEANMLIYCSRENYAEAVKYFWEIISQEEQERILFTALINALRNVGSIHWKNQQYHRKEQCMKTIIFLMKKLDGSRVEKENFIKYEWKWRTPDRKFIKLKNIDHFIELFLEVWPWTEFFLTAFNMVKPYFMKENYIRTLRLITGYIKEDCSFNFTAEHAVYQNMFVAVWREMPNNMKNEMREIEFNPILGTWLRAWDATIIKMILNEPLIEKIKERLINQVFFGLTDVIIEKNETEKADQFIDEVFAEEGALDIKIYKLIIRDDFASLKDLENSFEKVEFNGVKSKIVTASLVHFLVAKKNLNLVDKFLNWRFDDARKRNSSKLKVRDSERINSDIYQIWIKHNEKEAREESEKFINWFVKTPIKLDQFKKTNILKKLEVPDFDKMDDGRFYKPFVDADRYEMVIPFLNWTGIDKSYINKYRKILIKDVPISDYLENNEIEKADRFLKWAFSTEEERCKHLSKLIDCKKGILHCKKFIANVSNDEGIENLSEVFQSFINFWIKPSGREESIKGKLISWKNILKLLEDDEDDQVRDDWRDWCPVKEEGQRTRGRFREEIYCPRGKLKLFLSLLACFGNRNEVLHSDSDCSPNHELDFMDWIRSSDESFGEDEENDSEDEVNDSEDEVNDSEDEENDSEDEENDSEEEDDGSFV